MTAQEHLMEWSREGWKGAKTCPVCADNTWTPGAIISMISKGAELIPFCPVVCTHCGYTIFFHNAIARLVHEETPA